MKINIGPYQNTWTTSGLERRWIEFRYPEEAYWDVSLEEGDLLDRLVDKLSDGLQAILNATINKIPYKRKVEIKYHNYDTWSLDHTLALIILPGLKQLKATNHGYGSVDSSDLPTICLKDASSQERWEWVMDEMIWAFNELANECSGADNFTSGKIDLIWTKVDSDGNDDPEGKYRRVSNGPDYTFSIDLEGRKQYDDRIQRGLTLFGKYYRSLWD